MENTKQRSIFSGFIWKYLERIFTQGLQFIVSIFLARLLAPNDYGIIALVLIFIAFANVFITSGFNTALVQKKDIDDLDVSSVVIINFALSILMYILIFAFSTVISNFFGIPELTKILRVLSVTVIFGSYSSVILSIYLKRMQFKRIFFSSLISVLVSSFIGIYLASNDYGVWSLVFQSLAYQFILTINLMIDSKYFPKSGFSFARIKLMSAYSGRIIASTIISTIFHDVYAFVIGKKYSEDNLGNYSKGDQFPSTFVRILDSTVAAITFSIFSSNQDNKTVLKKYAKNSIILNTYFLFPLISLLFVLSDSVVEILLTDKWLGIVPYMRIACIMYAFWPIHTTNLQVLTATGNSKVYLRLEIIKKVIELLLLLVSIEFGIIYIAISRMSSSIIALPINAFPNKKIISYGFFEQFKDILPNLALSLALGFSVSKISHYIQFSFWSMAVIGIVAMSVYVFVSHLFKFKGYKITIDFAKDIIKSKRRE